MSDPLAYTTRDAAIISCGSCDQDNTTTIWGDTDTGEWGYEFDCAHCGEPNHAHEYGPSERGSTRAAFLVLLAGLALFTTGWWMPEPWAPFAIITGLFAALTILTIAASEWLTRKGYTT